MYLGINSSTRNSVLTTYAPVLGGDRDAKPVDSVLCSTATSGMVMFGGNGAADTAGTYQVVGWFKIGNGEDDQTESLIPIVLAAGAFTLGTLAYGDSGLIIGDSAALFADTVTDTLGSVRARVMSPANNTIAYIELDLRGARYWQVQIRRGTVAKVDVMQQEGPEPFGLTTDVDLTGSDINIGNVDIESFPAGNLDQQASAASLSVVQCSDLTDGTYIGDIKFGEALPAGTNGIGKLTANSGVDIGDVDLLRQAKTVTGVVKVVAATGTAVPLTAGSVPASWVGIQAKKVATDNTGNVFIGVTGLAAGSAEFLELAPGGYQEISAPAGQSIDLNDIYIDALTNDDGVVALYIPA